MQMPQSIKNIKNRIAKFINKIGEAICYLCGIAAILAIMIPAGFLVSLIPAMPTVSIIIVACVTPLYFGYKEIFDFGYNLPNAACEFVAGCCTSVKNKFMKSVFGIEPEPPELTMETPRSSDSKTNTSFLDYAKSWCPSFMCGTSTKQPKPNYGNDLEEEDPEDSPRLTRGGYKMD